MSRPRFLADHDLNEAIVNGALRLEPAIEFYRARDLGLSERPDDEVLDWAKANDPIVVSHDVNTMPAAAQRRLRANAGLAGLILIQQSNPVRESIEHLVLIWSATEADEWFGQICFLPL